MNRASFSLALSPPSPTDSGWQMLLPAGKVECRDGRGPYTYDPNTLLEQFDQWGMPIDVDYHHQSLESTAKTGLVPSAGSVVELADRDGAIWGRIEWTANAAAAIEAKEAKYLSPVFDYDQALRIEKIVSVGLTNLPNLYLNPLSVNSLGGAMDELIERLCYMLNLPVTSTPEEIKGHLQRLIDSLGQAPATDAAMNQLGVTLKLPGKPWAEIATAAHALCVPGATVPIAEFERVSHALNLLQEQGRQAEIDTAINQAKTSGKLAPSMEEWARGYAKQDLQGFKTWAANSLPVVNAGQIITDPANPIQTDIPPNVPNPERWELLGKAKAHQAAHQCTFVQAVKAVSSG